MPDNSRPPNYPPNMPWPPPAGPMAIEPPGTGSNIPGYNQAGFATSGGGGGASAGPVKPVQPGGVLSVQKTGGEDKYIVRTQIPGADPGVYKQTIMSGDQIKSAGGEIPIGTGSWGQGAGTRWASPDTPTIQSEKWRIEHLTDIPDKLKDYPQFVKDAYQQAVKEKRDVNQAVNDAITSYNDYLKRTGESYEAAEAKYEGDEKTFKENLRINDPYLYRIYVTEGADAYNSAVKKRNKDIGGIEARWAEKLRQSDPYLYSVYKEKGLTGYNAAVEKRKSDLSGIQERNYITIGDSMIHKNDWVKLDKKYQDIATSQGFDAMDKAVQKDIDDYNNAINSLRVYLIKSEPAGESAKVTPGKEYLGLKPAAGETYDIVKFLKENPGKEDVLRTAGYGEDAIKDASYFSKKNYAQKMWESMTPWKEERGEKATVKGGFIMAAEIAVPGVYAGRHWNEMSDGERAFAIGIDLLTLAMIGIPAVKIAGTAARTVGYASRGARFMAAVKGVSGYAVKQLAPVDIIIHPVSTGKAAIKEVRNLAELFANPKRISEPVITTSSGQVMFRVSDFSGNAKTAAKSSDILMNRLANGEQLFIKVGDTTAELRQSELMKKVGGGAAHATPDLTDFEKGLLVEWQKGKPIKEQGLFLSNEPVTSYTERGASGFGAIPIPTDSSGQVEKVGMYRPDDIAKMDADIIRPVTFSHAKGIPAKAAPILENITKKYDAKIAGSLNSYLKVPRAPRPNDIDLIFNSPKTAKKALDEIISSLNKAGFETKMHPTKRIVFIKQDGKWVEAVDLWTSKPYDRLIGNMAQPANKISGFNIQKLGENYIHQSYGAITQTTKAGKRIKSLNKLAPELLKSLKNDGAIVRKPGIVIFNPETAKEAVPTEKLFYAYTAKQGLVKEAETKLLTGEKTTEVGQKLWFRTGPRGIRTELWLEKPLKLSKADIIKLKAASILEDIKAPFRPALKIARGEAGRATIETAGRVLAGVNYAIRFGGLDVIQTRIFSRFLEKGGYITRLEAENLRRAERITRAADGIETRPPERATRSAETERMIRLNRAAPERAGELQRLREIERLRPENTRAGASRETPARETPARGRLPERPPREPPPREQPPREPPPREIPPRETPPRLPPRQFPPRQTPPGHPPVIPPKTQKEKRQAVLSAGGMAVAYQRGELKGKDVWHVWYQRPDTRDLERVIIMGRSPEGARIEDGPKSAYRSIQTLFGKGRKRRIITEDTGAVDTVIEISGKSPQISFEKDTISKGQQRISGQDERITEKPPRIK